MIVRNKNYNPNDILAPVAIYDDEASALAASIGDKTDVLCVFPYTPPEVETPFPTDHLEITVDISGQTDSRYLSGALVANAYAEASFGSFTTSVDSYVDWGDGTSTDIPSGTVFTYHSPNNNLTNGKIPHTYEDFGKYVIKIYGRPYMSTRGDYSETTGTLFDNLGGGNYSWIAGIKKIRGAILGETLVPSGPQYRRLLYSTYLARLHPRELEIDVYIPIDRIGTGDSSLFAQFAGAVNTNAKKLKVEIEGIPTHGVSSLLTGISGNSYTRGYNIWQEIDLKIGYWNTIPTGNVFYGLFNNIANYDGYSASSQLYGLRKFKLQLPDEGPTTFNPRTDNLSMFSQMCNNAIFLKTIDISGDLSFLYGVLDSFDWTSGNSNWPFYKAFYNAGHGSTEIGGNSYYFGMIADSDGGKPFNASNLIGDLPVPGARTYAFYGSQTYNVMDLDENWR